MINNKTIAVIVPAYNEEDQIGFVIETMPDFVDYIIVINDYSTDNTEEIVKKHMINEHNSGKRHFFDFEREIFQYDEVLSCKEDIGYKITLINHHKNKGKGGAIVTGYNYCLSKNYDCVATMDGDGQMDPEELFNICKPIVYDNIDYTKGNRLIHRSALLVIPKIRFIGNSMLSILTKIASGYWYVSDTQTGYTAISIRGLQSIDINKIYKKYGYCNDVLVKLNIARCTISEIEIKPVYDVGEKSKMNIGKVIPKLSFLLLKLFIVRIWIKYFINDMHPISLLYLFFSICFLITFLVSGWFFIDYFIRGLSISMNKLYFMIGMVVVSMQSLMFAMWLDIQDNKRLYKN